MPLAVVPMAFEWFAALRTGRLMIRHREAAASSGLSIMAAGGDYDVVWHLVLAPREGQVKEAWRSRDMRRVERRRCHHGSDVILPSSRRVSFQAPLYAFFAALA